jgi:hypothetical protein
MNRHILAWAASAALIGAAGAAPAMADSGGTQALGQSAGNQQSASSNATSTQVNPSNQNISVRVLSPGNNGPVTQTNSSQALSAAGNLNDTSQDATQTQGGGGGTQAADQSAGSRQSADSNATSTQIKPSNENISVRVLSDGNDGPVTQTNASQAGALAGNKNDTSQHADQSQGGGGGGTQAAEQQAYNDQHASADAESKQIHPSNQNIGVRVLSPGNDGPVTQTNASGAVALAGNKNSTTQNASQDQGGSKDGYSKDSKDCKCDDHGAPAIQAVAQKAVNKQDASADATSVQKDPSNVNAPVRVGSPGDNGSVKQSNVSFAGSAAFNANDTTQNASQDQGGSGPPTVSRDGCDYGCGHSSDPAIQALGQVAYSGQKADSSATSKQDGASNVNAPVSTGSYGSNGSVEQLNASGAESFAGNDNSTEQHGNQDQHGGGYGGPAIQALGQEAGNWQDADSDATSEQICPVNLNAPVSDSSYGGKDDKREPVKKTAAPGSVKQANLSWAKSLAGNRNHLTQWGTQHQ